jgi:flagellar basal-body rod modification protein FlgD
MITPTSQPGLFTSTSPAPDSSSTTLGKDSFLKLLVTQLQNQDPLSPLQPYEFAAQLAQFSTVEQLTQLNTAMAGQSQDSQLLAVLSQTQFSASLIGKDVVVQTDQITIPSSGAATMPIDVTGVSGKATLTLTDDSGKVIATRDLGHLSTGRQTLTLPSDLPPGNYHATIAMQGDGGGKSAVTTYVEGTVSAVHFDNGQITLRVGSLDLPLGMVSEIHPGGASN